VRGRGLKSVGIARARTVTMTALWNNSMKGNQAYPYLPRGMGGGRAMAIYVPANKR